MLPRWLFATCLSAALACAAGGLWAETYDEKKAMTDMQDPHQVYDLAMWCGENRLERSKARLLRLVIDLDPNHAPAREAQGFVYYRDDWVHYTRVPDGALARERAENDQAKRSGGGNKHEIVVTKGPGPKPADIDWELAPLHHDKMDSPQAEYLKNQILAKMQRASNYSGAMDSGFRTLLLEEYWELAVALLADGLSNGWYKDLYGPSMMIVETRRSRGPEKADRLPVLERLLPYLGKAAGSISDKQDLQMYCLVAANSGDKRHIPRIIELMRDNDEMLASAAKIAMSQITLLPEQTLSADSAQAWWDKYHASSNAAIYGQMLTDSDPNIKLGACKALYLEEDKRILPVLANLASKDHPRPISLGAVEVIKKITGTDFGLLDFDAENHAERIETFKKWIDEESNRFVWVEFRKTNLDPGNAMASAPRDNTDQWISQLTSLKAHEVRMAENNLKKAGASVYGKLVDGLSGKDALRAQKCRDLLREMTDQNFGFDPLDDASSRQAAIAKWQAWLAGQQGGGAEEGSEGGDP